MASYPSSVKTFTTKVDGVTTVAAADVNDVQGEIVAVETALGTNPATSVLGTASIGTYSSAPGALSNVSARLQNLEAGLTGDSTTGARIGYTQLAQSTLVPAGSTTAVTFNSISQNYNKLVLHIDITSYTAGGVITLTLNNVTTATYAYTRQVYGTATPSTSTTDTGFLIGSATGTNLYVIEIPAYARTNNGKALTSMCHSLSLTGYLATANVTRLDVTASTPANFTATVTLYGVK